MKEGEPVLGGPQAAPGSTAASNVGPQPVNPAAPPAPSSDFSSFQSSAQPNTQPLVAPSQPISPARPQSVPRLTNRFSDRAALNQSPQAPLINNTPQNMQFTPPNPQLGGYAPDIMSSPAPQPQKSKKAPIIILICLVLLAVGATIALAVTNMLGGNSQSSNPAAEPENTPLTKQEVYDILRDFNIYYESLEKTYNHTVGLMPNFKMSDDALIFPAETNIELISQRLKDTISMYNQNISTLPDKMDDGSIDLLPTKDSIDKSLQLMGQNVDLIQKFYDAYISPLFNNSKPTACSETTDMTNLNKGDTAEAASKYYTLYCNAINFLNAHNESIEDENTMELFKQTIATYANDAAAALNSILAEVPSAVSDINKLLKELLQ